MRVGILGGGQLARMLALAGHPLGLHVTVLDPGEAPCAAAVAGHIQADYEDMAALERLAAASDVVTYEFEQVPEAAVAALADRVAVHPRSEALGTGRDRLHEKSLFRELGIPTAGFAAVDSEADLESAVAEVGLPAVLKTRTMGYDGKGQEVLEGEGNVPGAWERLGRVPLILEAMVAFDREVSLVGVRGSDGDCRFYPVAENVHRDGILRESFPRPGDPAQVAAEANARTLLERLDYVGVIALEMFQAGDRLLANEMAPRVHNSGHWTIEGAETSQFANHMRGVCGLPLGTTEAVGGSAMINLIGELPPTNAVLAAPGAHLHLYDKGPRRGRKLGHITVRADDAERLRERIQGLSAALG
ncbi:5-(carboxyamino)imidazole ribonucleotide synthase [Thiohalorhabdus sp.]|uniref:5-(carboxyamino)imidazole ribonucleotide synthase n=1 Tax=Thiohalorhabdus sp. TaxID=3094134 RepID=UPI002FC328A6